MDILNFMRKQYLITLRIIMVRFCVNDLEGNDNRQFDSTLAVQTFIAKELRLHFIIFK